MYLHVESANGFAYVYFSSYLAHGNPMIVSIKHNSVILDQLHSDTLLAREINFSSNSLSTTT
jgi:hypothetical protein